MSIETLKLALRSIRELVMDESDDAPHALQGVRMRKENAITALRQAIAEAEQAQPAGKLMSDPDDGHVFVPRIEGDWSMLGKDLYTAPPPRQPLTDEQWQIVADTLDCFITRGQKDIIEAALGIKEKNT